MHSCIKGRVKAASVHRVFQSPKHRSQLLFYSLPHRSKELSNKSRDTGEAFPTINIESVPQNGTFSSNSAQDFALGTHRPISPHHSGSNHRTPAYVQLEYTKNSTNRWVVSVVSLTYLGLNSSLRWLTRE
jgi:hypothetical protein